MLPDAEKQRLFHNIATAMQGVPQFIIERQIKHFEKADLAYGKGVAEALGLVTESKEFSLG